MQHKQNDKRDYTLHNCMHCGAHSLHIYSGVCHNYTETGLRKCLIFCRIEAVSDTNRQQYTEPELTIKRIWQYPMKEAADG